MIEHEIYKYVITYKHRKSEEICRIMVVGVDESNAKVNAHKFVNGNCEFVSIKCLGRHYKFNEVNYE